LEAKPVKTSDQELILKVQQGDEAAFTELVCRYDRQVLSMANSFTKDMDEAQDIYQEVFIRVFKALGGFQFKSEFSTWLYRVTTNVCLTYQARGKKRTFLSLDAELESETPRADVVSIDRSKAVSPDRFAESRDIDKHIRLALDHLSPQQRLVFTLKHYQGYKLREIAEMMECSEGTVKKYLFTATDRMRTKLRKVF